MKKTQVNNILIQLALVITASILFAGSFPNVLFKNGLSALAWFAYIPILLVIQKSSFLSCLGWGAIYGYVSYVFFNYWLSVFHPLAGIIVYSIYLVYMAVVFLFLKLALILFPKKAYLVQWVIWLAYEYLKTTGFLGYSYGVTGYSQWQIIPLIQLASITGVWGISALVTFPSFWLAAALGEHGTAITQKLTEFFRKEKIPVLIWAASLAAVLIFGAVRNGDLTDSPKAYIALVQHNSDPWDTTRASSTWEVHDANRRYLAVLKRLSNEALSSEPKPQLVVWPETAFVPRIFWHSTYREDQASWLIVKELLDYLSAENVPFLIGNNDARMEPAKNPNEYERFRVDYNAAMFFQNGEINGIYRKLHLVPFTEHFPYKKIFPRIYKALLKADTHFWEKGEEETVFNGPGFTFSAPICFEDTFGYLSRKFVKNGADVLINLTNDAWAKSLPAQNQHLAMAVFRAAENYRPMVRSTVSGQTCAINPFGKVTAEAAPFREAWINVSVPLVDKTSIYTLYGDYFAFVFVFMAAILLLSKAVWCTMKKQKRGFRQ